MSRNSLIIFLVVTVFLGASMWKVDCPDCRGRGVITNTAALQSLRIIDLNPEVISHEFDVGEAEYEGGVGEGWEPAVQTRVNPVVRINDTTTMITFQAPPYEEQLCGEQIYTYEIFLNISLQNIGSTPLLGGIEALVRDSNTSWIIHKEPIRVSIDGFATHSVHKYVTKNMIFNSPKVLNYFDVVVRIPMSMDLICPTCHAKGEVSLLEWILIHTGVLSRIWG